MNEGPPDKGTSDVTEAPETQGKDNQIVDWLSCCVFFSEIQIVGAQIELLFLVTKKEPERMRKMYYDTKKSGKRLKELRMELGKTQKEVAADLGYSEETICRVESGDRGCSIDALLLYSEYYKVTVDYILLGVNNTRKGEMENIKTECVQDDIMIMIKQVDQDKKQIIYRILVSFMEGMRWIEQKENK